MSPSINIVKTKHNSNVLTDVSLQAVINYINTAVDLYYRIVFFCVDILLNTVVT